MMSLRLARMTRSVSARSNLMIKTLETQYLKHHPFYEFRNFDELHVDSYRHWLHGRADYFQSETYPGKVSAWEMGSKFNHSIYLLFPLFSFGFFGRQYVSNPFIF